jgi:hypothetical protein
MQALSAAPPAPAEDDDEPPAALLLDVLPPVDFDPQAASASAEAATTAATRRVRFTIPPHRARRPRVDPGRATPDRTLFAVSPVIQALGPGIGTIGPTADIET